MSILPTLSHPITCALSHVRVVDSRTWKLSSFNKVRSDPVSRKSYKREVTRGEVTTLDTAKIFFHLNLAFMYKVFSKCSFDLYYMFARVCPPNCKRLSCHVRLIFFRYFNTTLIHLSYRSLHIVREPCFLQLGPKINVTSNKVADRDGVSLGVAHRPWWSDSLTSITRVIDFD